jgi:hypothetical protein
MKYIIDIEPYNNDLLYWGLALEERFDEHPRIMAEATAPSIEACIEAACAHLKLRTVGIKNRRDET